MSLPRDKEGHTIKLKWTTHQKVLTVFNIYAYNKCSKLMQCKLTELKGKRCLQSSVITKNILMLSSEISRMSMLKKGLENRKLTG